MGKPRNVLFVCALFISLACTKNLTENKDALSVMDFSAASETLSNVDQTKVHFSDWSTYQLIWDSKDKITVFAEGIGYEFTNSMPDGDRAIFEGSVKPSSSYFALYPYNAEARVASGKIITKFPSTQKAVEYGTDKSAMIAVATENAGTLNFKNVYGILKFNIADEDITSVTLEGNNGEIIAGDIEITLGNEPSYSVTGNKSTEITLTPSGDTFAPGDYAIALLPVEFNEGFKLIFTHSSSSKAAIRATKSEKFSVKRNGGLDAQEMTFESGDYKYYYIRTKEELDQWHADYTNWSVKDKVYLANDIDYGGDTWVTQTASGTVFKGIFDGRGHSITNIHITSQEHAGFLRRVEGTVRNFTLGSATDDSDITSTASDSDRTMGGIAGVLVGGTVDNVSNYANLSLGTNTAYCGGIAGRVQSTTGESPRQSNITNCRNYGDISCTSTRNVAAIMGGIAGQLDYGSLTDATPIIGGCHNYGNLLSDLNGSAKKVNIGGVVGQVTCSAIIRDCHNGNEDSRPVILSKGSANKEFVIGGILGFNQTKAVSISNCTNYASITNESEGNTLYLGGIVGGIDKEASIKNCTNKGDILDKGNTNEAYNGHTTDGNARTGGIIGSCNNAASVIDCVNAGRVEINSGSVYMSVSGILGLNAGQPANILRCINTGFVGSTPVSTGTYDSSDPTSVRQNIRIGGIVAKTSVKGVGVRYCENYGDLKLNNTYKILRNWIGGAVGYAESAFMEDGKYHAVLSRGAVGGGYVRGIVARNAQQHGSLLRNGLGGTINDVTLTSANFNTGDYMWNSAGWSGGRSENYFLGTKPSLNPVESNVKVGCFNVWRPLSRISDRAGNSAISEYRLWEYAVPYIAQSIAAMNCDIIGFVELYSAKDAAEYTDTSVEMVELTDELMANKYSWHLNFPNKNNDTYTYCNGFAYNSSKLEMLQQPQRVWLNKKTGEYSETILDGYRTLVYAKFKDKTSGKEFWFAVTHLDLDTVEHNTNTAKAVVGWAEKTVEHKLPCILVGDMNCSSGVRATGYSTLKQYWSDSYECVKEQGFMDLQNATYPATRPGDSKLGTGTKEEWEQMKDDKWRFDHIFIDGVSVKEYTTVLDSYTAEDGLNYWLSDHFPITASVLFSSMGGNNY